MFYIKTLGEKLKLLEALLADRSRLYTLDKVTVSNSNILVAPMFRDTMR